MKGTTNAQRNAIIDSTSAVDSLTLTKADGTTQKHTVSNIIPKDGAPTEGSSKFVTSGAIYTALQGRVPVESGKGLSTNDYTTAEKSKVSNLPDNANNTFATKTELTNAVSSVYKYKGIKATYSALPASGNTTGDVWNVTAANGNIPAGTNYAWNGSAWDALGGEIDLSGYVPTSRTVNGKALTGNITIAASDVSAVPTTRKVNNKALSADITLSASDVGALATNGTAAKATADASGNNIVNTYATKTELTNGLAGKQNALTFDSTPTSGSSNPVTSGGVYSAINEKADASTVEALTTAVSNPKVSATVSSNNLTISVNGKSSTVTLPVRTSKFKRYFANVIDFVKSDGDVIIRSPISAHSGSKNLSNRYEGVSVISEDSRNISLEYLARPSSNSLSTSRDVYYFSDPLSYMMFSISNMTFARALNKYFEIYGYESFDIVVRAIFCVDTRPSSTYIVPIVMGEHYTVNASYSKNNGFSVSSYSLYKSPLYPDRDTAWDFVTCGHDKTLSTGIKDLYMSFTVSSIKNIVYST